MRTTVFLAFDIEARNGAKDLQPVRRIAANLDLRLDGAKRVEGLVE
jgi:hypothetical protein